MSYDLTTQAWIPVQHAGITRLVSLGDALTHAHEYQRLAADTPAQHVALTRLLLAVLHRAVDGPRSRGDWLELRAATTPPADAITAYLARHRERLVLDHPETPFMQTCGLVSTSGVGATVERMQRLDPDRRSGRGGPGAPRRRVSAAEAARHLVTLHAYDVSGIRPGVVGDPEANAGKVAPRGSGWCARGTVTMVEGSTLWETLSLAALPLGEDASLPVWERPPAQPGDRGQVPQGRLDLLTWQSRRVLLAHDAAGDVVGAIITNGDRLSPADAEPHEPFMALQTLQGTRERVPWKAREIPAEQLARAFGMRGPSVPAVDALASAPPTGAVELVSTRADHGPQASSWVDLQQDRIELPAGALGAASTTRSVLAEETRRILEARDAVGRLNADITRARGAIDPQQVRAAREEGRDVAWDALQRDWLAWVAHLDKATVDHDRDQWRPRARRVLRDLGEQLVLGHIDTPRLLRGRVDDGRQVAIPDADLHYRQALGRIFSDSYAVRGRGNAG